MDSAGNFRGLEGPGRNEDKKKRRMLKPLCVLRALLEKGEGWRLCVLSEGTASSRACPPSPSAAFHGGFLAGWFGSQRSQRIRLGLAVPLLPCTDTERKSSLMFCMMTVVWG